MGSLIFLTFLIGFLPLGLSGYGLAYKFISKFDFYCHSLKYLFTTL